MNIAVVDLGSNTFHLLIAKYDGDRFQEIYRKRVYARLARSGIGQISEEAFQVGLDVIDEFKQRIEEHHVSKVKFVGTEMLRLAPNGADFVRKVKERTGFNIEIISGIQEAEYIYWGVKQLFPKGSYLVMDIGGGSVEFIIVEHGEQKWMASFPIGIAVLFFDFHKSDPISDDELIQMRRFLSEKLHSLKEELEKFSIKDLVGASGVFETFFDIGEVSSEGYLLATDYKEKLNYLIHTSQEERKRIDAIPKMRKKMIIVATVLLESVLNLTDFEKIRFSQNSLKEGLLFSSLQE